MCNATTQEGDGMDDITRRELDELRRQLERVKKQNEIQTKYLELIGVELGATTGHFKKAAEYVNEMRNELKKI